MTEPLNVFWFRRDLRIEDNCALYEALKKGKTLPIFIFDLRIIEELKKDDARISFIHETLKKLHSQLNGSLKVYIGDPIKVWTDIINEFDVKNVFLNKDYEPYALERDKAISYLLESKQIATHQYKDQVIFEKNEVLKANGEPYTIYTPYKNKWLSQFTDALVETFHSEANLTNLSTLKFDFPSIEEIGFKKSKVKVPAYTFEKLENYEDVRNIPALGQTSYLSTHLRFGTVSVRKAVKLAKETNQTLLSELIWREFFMQILFHFPHVVTQSFKAKYDNIAWRSSDEDFEKWCKGETGYPIVDAGMRELNQTGLMHNRVRMITASFLCKHLLIDWREGEAYFAEKLLDYDLSANNGNWQWVAGTGCDSAPYFRIFNPTSQQQKFDSKAEYIRRWVSDFDELSYPAPMVEHTFARKRCLDLYKRSLS
ncbi:cryptochrome/photolyase family protein [Arcticibacterium luteifluviistationis]|uniref:Deoxyribodipyrimidine photolyase n=1 Tax=Arcticibacterium luteifluviistationis TaxID=1784714 RepID=A0A2Z4GD43_9BACT|nr:deoxyribodipyrimidine photo-lyase [Arcticibacterium luteifluviistationis]AWV99020.1 deoxyribodipyrimidine photolyase [Arcticibacterium luteifluviistationis]